MTIPILLVFSSENAFVLPSHSDTFLEAVGGPNKASKSIEACLKARRDRMAMHVSYLRSGHIVFQERARAMHMIIERMTSGIEKGKESVIEEDERRKREQEEELREGGLLNSESDVSSVEETSSEDEDVLIEKKDATRRNCCQGCRKTS